MVHQIMGKEAGEVFSKEDCLGCKNETLPLNLKHPREKARYSFVPVTPAPGVAIGKSESGKLTVQPAWQKEQALGAGRDSVSRK